MVFKRTGSLARNPLGILIMVNVGTTARIGQVCQESKMKYESPQTCKCAGQTDSCELVARQVHLFLGLTDAALFLLFSLFIQVQ